MLATTNASAALCPWERMDFLYGTIPNVHAFTIILDAVQHATLNSENFASAMQVLGIPFRLREAYCVFLSFQDTLGLLVGWAWRGLV